MGFTSHNFFPQLNFLPVLDDEDEGPVDLERPRPLGRRGRPGPDEDGGGGRGLAALLVDLQLRLVDDLLHEEVGLVRDVALGVNSIEFQQTVQQSV